MKLVIEPTPHFFMADGVMVRMWQGVDDRGEGVVALVTAVVVGRDASAERVAGLVSIPPPDAAAAQAWAERIMRGQIDVE